MFTWAIVFIVIATILFFLFGFAWGECDGDGIRTLFVLGLVFLVAGSITLYYATLGYPASGYSSLVNNIAYKVEAISKTKDDMINVVLSQPDGNWRMFSVRQEKAIGIETGKQYFTSGSGDSWKFEPFVQKELTNR